LQAEVRGAEHLGLIPVAKGIKQGCPCSPLIFSILFDREERAVKEASTNLAPASRHWCAFHSLQLLLLLFADDVALVAQTQEGLERLFLAFREFCTTHRLTINGDKTHVMVVGSRPEQQQQQQQQWVMVGGSRFSRVQQFRYLGVEVDERADPRTVATAVALRARRAFGALC